MEDLRLLGFLLFIGIIILTIVVWKRGWKGWALLPFGSDVVLAFVVSLISGTVSTSTVNPITGDQGYFVNVEGSAGSVWIDAACALVLTVVVFFPRRKAIRPQSEENSGPSTPPPA